MGQRVRVLHGFDACLRRISVGFKFEYPGACGFQVCLKLFGFQIAHPETLDKRRQAVLPAFELTSQPRDLFIFCGRISAVTAVRLQVRLQLISFVYGDLKITANVFYLVLQVIAPRKRFLDCLRQLFCAILGIRIGRLVLADLLHQPRVLVEEPIVFIALCLDLFLPSCVDRCFLLFGSIATHYPPDDGANDCHCGEYRDMYHSDFRHSGFP